MMIINILGVLLIGLMVMSAGWFWRYQPVAVSVNDVCALTELSEDNRYDHY